MIRISRSIRVLIALATTIPIIAILSAYATYSSHEMSGGLQGRQYWLDGSIGSTIGSEIYSAKWLWGNATSLISLAETQTKANAEFEFYQSSQVLSVCGTVNRYDNGDPAEVDPYSENWDYGKVILTSDLGYGDGCTNTRGDIIHEMGHIMGLAHVSSGTAIMRFDLETSNLGWAAPKADDVNGIQYLY